MKTKTKIKGIVTALILFLVILLFSSSVNAVVGPDYDKDVAGKGGEWVAQNISAIKGYLGQSSAAGEKGPNGADSIFKYKNLLCAHAGQYTSGFIANKYRGVIEINPTYKDENNSKYGYAELTTENGTYTDLDKTTAAYLAYVAWATDSGKYSGGDGAWQNHWYAEFPKLNSFLGGGRIRNWLNNWNGSKVPIQSVKADATAYSNFVTKIGEDGKFISNDNNKTGTRAGDNQVQVTFDKLLIDENYNKYKGPGTNQQIRFSVTAQDGSVASFWVDKDGTHDRRGNALTINGKSFESITLADLNNQNWTIQWADSAINATNPIMKVTVGSRVRSYHGAIVILTSDDWEHTLQGRIVVGGGFGDIDQSVEFTFEGGTKIRVDKCWSGYKQAKNFQMPGSVGFILYAMLDTGLEVEYGRYSIPNNGTDRWTFETEVEMTMEGGFVITSFRVEEDGINLGEGWTTTVSDQGNNYWVITNAYKQEEKVPLLELNKVNEVGRELVNAKLNVTVDNYYSTAFETKTEDPDITITYNEVIVSNPKMVSDFKAQNAVELFNYSKNKKPQGPVGDFATNAGNIYLDLRDILYSRLMADLQSDPKYIDDLAHYNSLTTHYHPGDPEGYWDETDRCGACPPECAYAAGRRVAAANKAVYDYVYGGSTFQVGIFTAGGRSRAINNDKKTLFGGDIVISGDKVYRVEVDDDRVQSLKEYATLQDGDIVSIDGHEYIYTVINGRPVYNEYQIRVGDEVKKDDQNYKAVIENGQIKLRKYSELYKFYKNDDIIKIGNKYYQMNFRGSGISMNEYTNINDWTKPNYYENGIEYEWDHYYQRYEAKTTEATHTPFSDGDVVVDGRNSYKVNIDSNGVSMPTYRPEIINENNMTTVKPNYIIEGGEETGELIEADPNCTLQTIKGIDPDDILRDLYLKADDFCEVPYYHSPLHADFEFSVWYMYENYSTTCVHLNDLAAIYTTKHENEYDLQNFDKEMEIKLEETEAPKDYLKWAHDNDKHLYLTWELGQVTDFHYDEDDNDSRELEYIDKESTDTKLPNAITESCENGITWTLMSIRAWDAKIEDIIKFTKYAELANGNSSNTLPMDGVTFTIQVDTEERLDGKGIAQGGLKSESWTVQKTTDKNGYIGISTKELQDNLKIDVISRWIGKMTITYTEVDLGKYAPYYEKWFTPRSVTIEFNEGSATIKGEEEGPGEDAIVNSTQGYHVLTSGYDTPSWAPQMIIKKTDMAGNALRGAEFDVTVRSDRGDQVNLGKCVTNEAGEYIIYPQDLRGLGITTMNRWTGDLTLIARETKAPENYTNLNENRDIIATIHFAHGQIVPSGTSINQGNHVDWSIHNTWYEDEQTWEGSSPTFVLSVKNSLDNNLRIRKIEANTEKQDYLDDRYLNEAEFEVTIRNGNNRQTRAAKLDNKGYFILRDDSGRYTMSVIDLADRVVGDLGQFDGSLEVSIRETKTPSGYIQITDTMTVYLNYDKGYYYGATYNNDTSKVLLDVGKSDDETTVTIAVKNTKVNLQPIYIQKMDPTTNMSVKGVAFDVTISKNEITEQDSIRTKTYTTGNEGMIAIETSELNKIGINNGYSGDLYVLIEEVEKEDGYTMLEGPVYVHIVYENGSIRSSQVLRGDGNTAWINKDGTGMLKIIVNNPWEIPDIEIAKETLTNGETYLIDEATFDITLTADNMKSFGNSYKVSEAGKIVFDSKTLERELGIDGKYTGNIYVDISEIDVRDDAAVVNEGFTVTLTYKDGRMVSSEVSNKTHASVVRNDSGSKVTIMVNDSIIIPDHIFLGGYVWEEKATTKSGLLKDGIYTQMSDSEHTDLMLTGIEVTLYEKQADGTLKFVDKNVAGTNPTLTDVNGYYEFEVPKGPEYVVKFTYNGQAFEDVAVDMNSQIYSKDWASKGTEINANTNMQTNGETRDHINNMYNEIGSYPANYKVGNFVFSATEAREHFALAENNDIYNISYRNTEISEVRDRVAIETNNYLAKNKYINQDNGNSEVNKAYTEIYRNVINNYYTENGQLKAGEEEIYNKLQFIHDSRMSAVAGDRTENYELVDFVNLASYNDTYKYINLAIVKRDMTDLTLAKDAYSATVSINRKDTIYDYDKSADKYSLLNYEKDYNYNTAPNSNGLAYYNAGEDEAELYFTYKVTVINETDIDTQLTEIVDYFDSKFGYKDLYTTSSGASIQGIRAYKLNNRGERTGELTGDLDTSRNGTKGTSTTGRYIGASRIGLIGNNYPRTSNRNNEKEYEKYSELFITFANGREPNLKMGEGVEFYITIKLGKGEEQIDREGTKKPAENYLIAPKYNGNKDRAMDILKTAINDPANLQKIMDIYNYAEVNGYQTYEIDANGNKTPKGYFDNDSKPGTFVVKDFEDIMNDYRNAFKQWQSGNKGFDRNTFAELLDKVNKMRGDDTWAVEIDVQNNLNDERNAYYHRTINGNVWEAVSDNVKTSTDLYRNDLLTYIQANGIQGIPVELVELEPDGDQIVRAKTITGADGSYTFIGFIPGDYTVRFIYGAERRDGYTDNQNTAMNNTSRNGYNNVAQNRGVNGQYYQSTKANPNTDVKEYWYAQDIGTRYSDAYDEVTARIEQIEAQTKRLSDESTARNSANNSTVNVDNSWSWDYEWDGVYNVQTRNHIDQMEAYTSTMQFEVENTKVQLEGIVNTEDTLKEADYKPYRYSINNIDFGLTPRAEADLKIDKYVSNLKVYLQDNTNNANGTLQLDVDFLANGSVQKYNNDALFNNIVIPTPGENNTAYRDGLLEVLYDTQLLNGATIEVTYTITVSNEGEANTITYYYDGNEIAANGGRITENLSPIAHSYYNGHGEELNNLILTERDRGTAKVKLNADSERTFEDITYHPTTVFNGDYSNDTSKTNTYKKTNYTMTNNGEIPTTNTIVKHNTNGNNARLVNNDNNKYAIKEAAADRAVFVDVRTRATNIIDYIDPNLNFTQTNMKGEAINLDWELTDVTKFNSTREGYKGTGVATDVMTKYNNIIRAVGGDTYTKYLSYLAAVANNVQDMVWDRNDASREHYSTLYTPLLTGNDVDGNGRENSITATLTLSKVLQTSSTETNDYEYSNLIELARMENYAGKVIDLESYDITGENNPETSKTGDLANVPSNDVTKLEPPTLGTSKSETIVIHEPTGLSISEAPKANLGIVLIVLVILAGGIVLIKKFVLTPKNS